MPKNAGEFDFTAYHYVADAVDTVSAKLALVAASADQEDAPFREGSVNCAPVGGKVCIYGPASLTVSGASRAGSSSTNHWLSPGVFRFSSSLRCQ